MKAEMEKPKTIYHTKKRFFIRSFFLLFSILAVFGYSTTAFSNETAGYTYNERGRLSHADYQSGYSFRYTYDAAGNIMTLGHISQEDQDGDFLPDTRENTSSCPYIDDADSDDDGIPDGFEDINRNGVIDSDETDPCNPDTDNDGIQDGTEDTDHNGRVDAGESNPAVVLNKHISGTLYAPGGTPAAEPVLVKAYTGDSCSYLALEAATWSAPGTGAYCFENLRNDVYYILAEPSETTVIQEWCSAAGDAFDCHHADQIVLTSVSEITGNDIYLNQSGSITGVVLESGGAVPAESGNLSIRVYGQNACTGALIKSTSLNPSDGSFSVEGLSAGTYFVKADTGVSGYQPEWWATGGEAHDCSTAEALTIVPGAPIDTIDIHLDKGNSISGTLYQSNGTMAVMGETIVIEAYAQDACTGNPFVSALINEATGTYTLTGLKPGTYFLKARDLGTAYIEEWWSDAGNAFNCLQAGSVVVTDQTDVPDIDFQLDAGGVISGAVFESDGETPVTDSLMIEFYLYPGTSTAGCDTPLVTFTKPGGDGSYQQALPPGKYYMRINPIGTAYAFAWWNGTGGTISCEDAYYTTVQAGVTASDKTFKLQPASAISGHIYQSDGVTPVAEPVEIIAYSDDPCNAREVTRGSYDPDTGLYVIHNLSNNL
ncbi:hypothetical protein [Desulfobacula sp.]|uniref:MSCRAMM family protein n=1 Tax=Desulfobacula sp. TaxID=2593537 RepID=UPI002638BF53|nr:hypothetical protein [Desulfobacula sp.]